MTSVRRHRLPHHDAAIRHHLARGGLIAYPTESCFGLGCLPNKPRALKKLIRLKKRPAYKGLISIAASCHQLKPWLAPLPATDWQRLQQTWPAALTYLLPAAPQVLPLLRGHGRQKIGVRIPDHALARELCHVVGSALVSTSANRNKQKPAKTIREIKRHFGQQVMVISGCCGKRHHPSQIIDFYADRIIR